MATNGVALWNLADAVILCTAIEKVCPEFGCHVALTGGCLYEEGHRKDVDILFYRIRQWDEIDTEGLFEALESLGIKVKSGFGWCYKLESNGRKIDAFFPEESEGDNEYR